MKLHSALFAVSLLLGSSTAFSENEKPATVQPEEWIHLHKCLGGEVSDDDSGLSDREQRWRQNSQFLSYPKTMLNNCHPSDPEVYQMIKQGAGREIEVTFILKSTSGAISTKRYKADRINLPVGLKFKDIKLNCPTPYGLKIKLPNSTRTLIVQGAAWDFTPREAAIQNAWRYDQGGDRIRFSTHLIESIKSKLPVDQEPVAAGSPTADALADDILGEIYHATVRMSERMFNIPDDVEDRIDALVKKKETLLATLEECDQAARIWRQRRHTPDKWPRRIENAIQDNIYNLKNNVRAPNSLKKKKSPVSK